MKITIYSYESYKYREVYKIIKWKDECVFETKSIGFISIKREKEYPPNKFILSSISTHLTKNTYCVLNPFLEGGD